MSFERIPLLVIGISHQYLFYIVISSIEGTEKQIIIESFILDNDCYLLLNKELKP